jgi:hypothetical protein
MRREQGRAVRRCLAQLAQIDREVLLLRVFDGLSNAEAAALQELPPETTEKRFSRARCIWRRISWRRLGRSLHDPSTQRGERPRLLELLPFSEIIRLGAARFDSFPVL